MNNYCTLPRDRSLHLFLQISLDVNVLLPTLDLLVELGLLTPGIVEVCRNSVSPPFISGCSCPPCDVNDKLHSPQEVRF